MSIVRMDWVYVETDDFTLLHAPGPFDNDADNDWYGDGPTMCGLEGPVTIPGIFSRIRLPRCATCCQIMLFPEGNGSPKNDDLCRQLLGLPNKEEQKAILKSLGES